MRFVLFISIFLIHPLSAKGADFSFSPNGPAEWQSALRMSGPIVDGDAAKFREALSKNPESYLLANFLMIDSPGGNIAAAAELATEIERSALAVQVESKSVCHSSCFLLFVAGQYRMVLGGKIGLHRPYQRTAEYVFDNSEYNKDQQKATFVLRTYLSSRSVPSDLIDKMMSLPSSTVYLLSNSDVARIGYLSPLAEELSIKQCQLSNSNNVETWNHGQFDKIMCLFDSVLQPMKFGYLRELIGAQRTLRASNAAVKRREMPRSDD